VKVATRQVKYGTHVLEFTLHRRDRKTLEIAVEPDARVTVVAPLKAPVAKIDEKVRKRAAWILRKQRYFFQFMPRSVERRYVSGETHLYLGRRYRLKVTEDSEASVKLKRGFIVVCAPKPKDPELTRALVEGWYNQRAHLKFNERLEVSLERFPEDQMFRPKSLIIRELKSRWGSMSPSSRLLLNRRLVQAPVDAIDYVITHELCHIAEPHHGSAFFDMLEKVMPDWQKRKNHLERIMA